MHTLKLTLFLGRTKAKTSHAKRLCTKHSAGQRRLLLRSASRAGLAVLSPKTPSHRSHPRQRSVVPRSRGASPRRQQEHARRPGPNGAAAAGCCRLLPRSWKHTLYAQPEATRVSINYLPRIIISPRRKKMARRGAIKWLEWRASRPFSPSHTSLGHSGILVSATSK